MKYADKIRHAEKAAEELTNQTSIEDIRASLKEKGLYDYDIDNVMTSARNIIAVSYTHLTLPTKRIV